MIFQQIRDFDDAYRNAVHVPGGDRWPAAWMAQAEPARAALTSAGRAELDIAYGDAPRQRLDLFRPEGRPRGLVVFVHGGYWMALDKSVWSHLALGPLAHGYAVAIPSYTLCPDIRIAGITVEIGHAVAEAARRVDGSIRLVGHSAGGHLVARMVSASSPLPPDLRRRIAVAVPISGVHDLRPLMGTAMNATLRLDAAEAAAESPALLAPMAGARIVCWVGADERPEFLRQSALLANVWIGLGAATAFVAEPDRHHFDVVDGLADPAHPLTGALVADHVGAGPRSTD